MDGAPRFFSGSLTLGASGLPSTDRLADRFFTGNGKIQGAVPRRIGRTKGGLNSKLHAVCDGKGRPIIFAVGRPDE